MNTNTRVTAYLQDDEDILSRQARLVVRDDLTMIDRVFKTFGIQYDVDEIPPNARLYSLVVSMSDRYISDNLLTSGELKEHISRYLGKGRMIEPAELKKLLNGTIPQIYKTSPAGDILIGYEFTIPKGDSHPLFRLPSLRLRNRNTAKPA